jgi:hypothetical protein
MFRCSAISAISAMRVESLVIVGVFVVSEAFKFSPGKED